MITGGQPVSRTGHLRRGRRRRANVRGYFGNFLEPFAFAFPFAFPFPGPDGVGVVDVGVGVDVTVVGVETVPDATGGVSLWVGDVSLSPGGVSVWPGGVWPSGVCT